MSANQKKWCSLFLILTIAFGCLIRVVLLFYNRSLWVDEAMLAQSILSRPLNQLFHSPLDYSQSAPIGYLLILKLLTSFLGSNEWVLRIISLISGLGIIILVYSFLKNTLKVANPLVGTTLVATLPILIDYSNELKPYMLDAFLVLLCIYLIYLYRSKKISLYLITLSYSILVWFSFPLMFVVGAIMIVETARTIINKSKTEFLGMMASNFCIVFSILIYATLWIIPSSVSLSVDANEYWRHLSFPIFPKSSKDLKLIIKMINNIRAGFGSGFGYLYMILCLLSLYKGFTFSKYKNFVIYFLVSMVLVAIISSFGKFPIQNRLLLFIYPFISILVSILPELFKSKRGSLLAMIGCCLLLLYNIVNSSEYLLPKHAYKSGEEINSLISYVNENTKSDEKIYVFASAIPTFSYKNQYVNYFHDFPENPIQIGNIIYGSDMYVLKCEPYKYFKIANQEKIKQNSEIIINNKKVYLLFSHVKNQNDKQITDLLNSLKETGDVKLIKENYKTYLYCYALIE